jgi:hypothetical protein
VIQHAFLQPLEGIANAIVREVLVLLHESRRAGYVRVQDYGKPVWMAMYIDCHADRNFTPSTAIAHPSDATLRLFRGQHTHLHDARPQAILTQFSILSKELPTITAACQA